MSDHTDLEPTDQPAETPRTLTLLRDQIAVAAVEGVLANSGRWLEITELATYAYNVADALLAERDRCTSPGGD